jgi:CubicO group peptidase (beta-lactamase class C family)
VISSETLVSAALFAFVTSITPGPNNAMLMASGMNFGFARTVPHMLGICLGFPAMLVMVGLGFGAAFAAFPVLHAILEVASGAYLLWLAWRIARAGSPDAASSAAARPLTALQAAAFQWVNPKAWVIATGAVALFLRPETFHTGLVSLALLCALVSLPCIAVWTLVGQALGRMLEASRTRRVFNFSMAALLAASVLLPHLIHPVHAREAIAHRVVTQPLPATVLAYENEREFSGVVEVWQGNQQKFERVTGLADRSFQVPVGRNTRFQIASVSKLFVTVAILKLVDQGDLALSDPIGKHVSGLDPSIAQATIEDLLLHRSGLSRDTRFDPWENLNISTHVERIGRETIGERLRGQYNYSNSGFVLLAKAVETVSGRGFDQFLQQELLDPLSLHDTGFIIADAAIDRLAVGYARGPDGWRMPWRARHRGIYAPGGLYSTSSDLARFFRALRSGRILSAEMTQRVFAATLAVDGGRQRAAYAGLVSRRNEHEYLLIAGSGEGAKASLMYAAHSDVLIVILSNSGDLPVNDMMRDVLLTLEGEKTRLPAPCQIADAQKVRAFVGTYDLAWSGFPAAAGRTSYEIRLSMGSKNAFLWDATDNSMTMLCDRGDGQLRAAETDTVRVTLSDYLQGEKVIVLTIEGKSYIARKRVP